MPFEKFKMLIPGFTTVMLLFETWFKLTQCLLKHGLSWFVLHIVRVHLCVCANSDCGAGHMRGGDRLRINPALLQCCTGNGGFLFCRWCLFVPRMFVVMQGKGCSCSPFRTCLVYQMWRLVPQMICDRCGAKLLVVRECFAQSLVQLQLIWLLLFLV